MRAPTAMFAGVVIVLLVGACSSCDSNPYGWRPAKYPARTIQSEGQSVAPFEPPPAAIARGVELRRIARGFHRPVAVVDAPGDAPGRLYVVEQRGIIRIMDAGVVAAEPFAELVARIRSTGNEQGLLGLAFHPQFATNRRLVVNFTDTAGDTRVIEYRADATGDRLLPDTARDLVRIRQPWENHNGGHVVFGPDGLLYVGTGDGGSAGDPKDAAQSPWILLGKMLVVDVDAAKPKPRIIQIGLRNPWRYSFDRATGDLYIADVGQDLWEWVHVVPAGQLEGHNFGWNRVEGSHCFARADCDPRRYTLPAVEYSHDEGCSITGGYVYRGAALPQLRGHYFFADYCTGLLRSFRWDAERGVAVDRWEWRPVLDPDSVLAKISSFGEDEAGELYLVSLDGEIYQLQAAP